MESQPQKTEFRINPENFHPCNKQNTIGMAFHWWANNGQRLSSGLHLAELFRSSFTNDMGLNMRKAVFEVCNQIRSQPACSATETS